MRQAAAEAYAYSQKDSLVESHLYSKAYAIKAVALSFFNVFSYFVRSFGHVITHGAELDFKGMAIDFGKDNLYALQSILLSAFRTFYVGCALLLPKVVFNHFVATPPPPHRDLLSKVNTLTLQNEQLAGALYVQTQGHVQNAYALQAERNARNVERANSFAAISYLDAETKRISAEKAHEVNQRELKAIVDMQLADLRNQLLFQIHQKNVAEYTLEEISRDKTLAEIQVIDLKNQLHLSNPFGKYRSC